MGLISRVSSRTYRNKMSVTYNLTIKNIPKQACRTDLKHIFAGFGEIHDIQIHGKGLATIKYYNQSDADRAYTEVNEKESWYLDDNLLEVGHELIIEEVKFRNV